MVEVRCKGCGKLLGKFDGAGEVKCPKSGCGGKNAFNTKTGSILFTPVNHVSMKNRTTSSGVTFR